MINVKELRQKLELTPEQLAKKLGVNWRTVYRWESGESLPRGRLVLKALDRLARRVKA